MNFQKALSSKAKSELLAETLQDMLDQKDEWQFPEDEETIAMQLNLLAKEIGKKDIELDPPTLVEFACVLTVIVLLALIGYLFEEQQSWVGPAICFIGLGFMWYKRQQATRAAKLAKKGL